jgi:hypothetical protein
MQSRSPQWAASGRLDQWRAFPNPGVGGHFSQIPLGLSLSAVV